MGFGCWVLGVRFWVLGAGPKKERKKRIEDKGMDG
jgi:hypothetical protein